MNGSNRERGAVMVWALIFVIVTAGMIVSHTAYMASHRQTMDVHLKRKPLAANFARAALTDALSWFQAQSTQPVTEFAPLLDSTQSPPVLDTQDPTLGLVREFEIRGNLWGRYEIRKEETTDLSLLHGSSAPGTVWELAARGYVYRVVDARKRFDEAPNQVVSMSRMETTMRSVPLELPAQAAVDVDDLSRVTIGTGGRVRGGTSGPALAGPPLSGLLSFLITTLTSLVTGTPGVLTVTGYKSSPLDVFRMSLAELRDVSNLAVSSLSSRWLTKPLPDNAIVYHRGDLTITSTQRLLGAMLLVVDGNLTVQPGSDSQVQGVVYVTGNTILNGPFSLAGALVARGDLLIQGNGPGQDAVVQYDAAALQRLTNSLSRYRASRAVRSLDDGRLGTSSTPPVTGTGTTIQPTADVKSDVVIGTNVQVFDGVRIDSYVTIGDNSVVRTEAELGKGARIGTGVQVGQRSIVDDFATVGDNVVIGDDVKIEPGAKIAPGTTIPSRTVIRSGTSYP